MHSLVLAALVATATPADASTSPAETARAPHLLVETDPSTFAFGGFAAHARLTFGHAAVGLGAYAMNFPDVLVDNLPGNRGEDFGVRLQLGVGAFGDWFVRDDSKGLFVGAQAAVQRYRYTHDAVPDATGHGTNVLFMPRVGYLYQPFDAGFYLEPWMGLGLTARVAGDGRVGDRTYRVFPVIPYAALHVGWRF